MKATKPFATEADMCARFLCAVEKKGGWTPYAETAGWDILLVRNSDGFQIGIQAKLKLNAEVINQAIESGWIYSTTRPGPDCRAVMVPENATGALECIANHIGLTVIRVFPPWRDHCDAFRPGLPDEKRQAWGEEWFECCPTKRHALPEYVPDVPAGDSAPLQLTKWKISAIKIAVTLEQRGFVTRDDFKHHGIDHRRWVPQGWLEANSGRYVRGQAMPDFKAQHPKVYAQIAADAEKWMPPASGPLFGKDVA